jgi:hypothetical protein
MPASATAINSKHLGDSFEQQFIGLCIRRGIYHQKMPPTVGYDFTVGIEGLLLPVELKYVPGGKLRPKHFTPIERIVAEEMTEAGLPYYVAFPLFDRLGRVTWSEIRAGLMAGGVILDNPRWVWEV